MTTEHEDVDIIHPDAVGADGTFKCAHTGEISWAGTVYAVKAGDLLQLNHDAVRINGVHAVGVPDSRVSAWKAELREGQLDHLTSTLRGMSPENRAEFIGDIPFCRHCGEDLAITPNGVCHCENDE